ncbi:VOC family protein [Niveibacterium sp. SC-1]|uniref:VOC family protein n=1 Tax=Niveibacterium sp. SC-1 TaxID=3135646 RepID=UPI00312004BC
MNTQTPNASPVQEVFPYLRVCDAKAAIAFYTHVFGAQERMRLNEPDGRIGHCELILGSAVLMLSDAYPEYDIHAPDPADPNARTVFALHLHVDNADALAERAVAAGARLMRPPTDQFYGERSCVIRDPFGHEWMLGHQIEELSTEEMQRRYDALLARG